MKRILVVGMMSWVVALALPGTALAAWSDCPAPFDGQSCTVGLNPVYYDNTSQIQCDLGTYGDLLYAVDDGDGFPWAYGYIGTAGPIDKFCCSPSELGGSVKPILVYAGTGADEICLVDDTVHHCDDNDGNGAQVWTDSSEIWTDSGADKIDTATTGAYADWIDSGNDNDLVSTYDGDDFVYLNQGCLYDSTYHFWYESALVEAGAGNDRVEGGAGPDTIMVGAGWDVAFGYQHDDTIMAPANDTGTNTLWGGEGNDTIYGGAAFDMCYGGLGEDVVKGGAGDGDWVCGDDPDHGNATTPITDGAVDRVWGNDGAADICASDDNSEDIFDSSCEAANIEVYCNTDDW